MRAYIVTPKRRLPTPAQTTNPSHGKPPKEQPNKQKAQKKTASTDSDGGFIGA